MVKNGGRACAVLLISLIVLLTSPMQPGFGQQKKAPAPDPCEEAVFSRRPEIPGELDCRG
jgi:hypothetical protein